MFHLTKTAKNAGSILKKKLLTKGLNRSAHKQLLNGEITTSNLAEIAPKSDFIAYGQVLREQLARTYLHGSGVEIGALQNPLQVPFNVNVKYIDRISVKELRKHYPELATYNLVEPDILDDGEVLASISDASQDFVIANHLLEHCQDPIGALSHWLRVLKSGGILYLAIPDMRFTFDKNRQPTSIEHLLKDHREGPAWSKRQHYLEWVTKVGNQTENEEIEKQLKYYLDLDYSIHFHAWSQLELFELLVALKKVLNFDFEVLAFIHNQPEMLFILKKPNEASLVN